MNSQIARNKEDSAVDSTKTLQGHDSTDRPDLRSKGGRTLPCEPSPKRQIPPEEEPTAWQLVHQWHEEGRLKAKQREAERQAELQRCIEEEKAKDAAVDRALKEIGVPREMPESPWFRHALRVFLWRAPDAPLHENVERTVRWGQNAGLNVAAEVSAAHERLRSAVDTSVHSKNSAVGTEAVVH